MCKNLMIVGIKPDKQRQMWEFMHAMSPIMTLNDDDGLGYAAFTDKGIFVERWLKTANAFIHRAPFKEADKQLKEDFKGLLEGDEEYNIYAEDASATGSPVFAVVMHARMATTPVALKNVHPFVRDGAALIHNGIISNTQDLKMLTSSCDSECILNSYVDHDVAKKPDNISQVSRDLRGGYACGVLTKNAEGIEILDIFRSTPSLSACYIKELGAIVFCTQSLMVEQGCKQLNWTPGNFFRVKDDKMIRINARTGKFMSSHTFYSMYSSNTGSYGNGGYYGNSYSKQPASCGMEKKSPKLLELEVMRQKKQAMNGNQPNSNKCTPDGTTATATDDEYKGADADASKEADPFYVKGEGYRH